MGTKHNRLIDNYSWEEIVINIANQIQARNPNFKRKEFIEWYKTKEYVGKPFDPTLIYFSWKGYKKLKDDKDNITVICGLEGDGKSTLGINYCSLISQNFNFDSTCYDNEELKKNMREAKGGDSVLADEGGVMLFSREAMNKTNKAIIKILMAVRERNINLVICVPNFFVIDSYIREHRVNMLLQIKKRGLYRGFLKEGIEIINRNAKHKNVMGVKMGTDKFWDGTFNKELPKDYDYISYKKKKNKNIDIALSPSKDYEEILNNSSKAEGLIPLHIVAKKLYISNKTVNTLIKKMEIPKKKMGSYWYITIEDYKNIIKIG